MKAMAQTANQHFPGGYGYGGPACPTSSSRFRPGILRVRLRADLRLPCSWPRSMRAGPCRSPSCSRRSPPCSAAWWRSGCGGCRSTSTARWLILLIGIAAKNAILIVEFAKDRLDSGERTDIREAAEAGARTRYRPVMMTAIALIFGVVPLVIASGARAARGDRSARRCSGACCWRRSSGSCSCPCCSMLWSCCHGGSSAWCAGASRSPRSSVPSQARQDHGSLHRPSRHAMAERERLGDVDPPHRRGAGQIGDGAGDAQHARVAARRQAEPVHRLLGEGQASGCSAIACGSASALSGGPVPARARPLHRPRPATRAATVALGSPAGARASSAAEAGCTSTTRSMRSSSGPLIRIW